MYLTSTELDILELLNTNYSNPSSTPARKCNSFAYVNEPSPTSQVKILRKLVVSTATPPRGRQLRLQRRWRRRLTNEYDEWRLADKVVGMRINSRVLVTARLQRTLAGQTIYYTDHSYYLLVKLFYDGCLPFEIKIS